MTAVYSQRRAAAAAASLSTAPSSQSISCSADCNGQAASSVSRICGYSNVHLTDDLSLTNLHSFAARRLQFVLVVIFSRTHSSDSMQTTNDRITIVPQCETSGFNKTRLPLSRRSLNGGAILRDALSLRIDGRSLAINSRLSTYRIKCNKLPVVAV